jgi:hypothetical protein
MAGFTIVLSVGGQLGRVGLLTHSGMLLLLLRKHVRLLRLEMRQRMGIRAHAWLHAHHRSSLAHGTVGT